MSWEQQIAKLRLEYEQLLFFRIPKLLRLYSLITSRDDHIDTISEEVGFLFRNKPEVRYSLKEAVKVKNLTYMYILLCVYILRVRTTKKKLDIYACIYM